MRWRNARLRRQRTRSQAINPKGAEEEEPDPWKGASTSEEGRRRAFLLDWGRGV